MIFNNLKNLAEQGMYHKILLKGNERNIYYIEALAKTGKVKQAIELLKGKKITDKPVYKRIFSFIGSLTPNEVLNNFELPKTDYYTNLKAALNSLNNISYNQQYTDTLTQLRYAILNNNIEDAKELANSFFNSHNLNTPNNFITDKGITLKQISKNKFYKDFINNKKISVILTSHNEENYISFAIESILNQTYKNLELIIVDDASDDKTPAIAEKYLKQDTRVKLIKLTKNVGTWEAKNIALKQCTGNFITCHDSDDYAHESRLELQAKPLLENDKLQGTTSKIIRIDEKNGTPYSRIIFPLIRFSPCSFMYRKEVLDKTGFYHKDLLGGDCEFIDRVKVFFGKKSVKSVNKPLTFGSFRENSLTTNLNTGFSNLGYNKKRQEHWEQWKTSHTQYKHNKTKLYVEF